VTRTIDFLKHNAIALCSLFIALGGTSYAAVTIPRNSISARQLRKGAVTTKKIHAGAITPGKLAGKSFGGRILYYAEISGNGGVMSSDPRGITTQGWSEHSGGGLVTFPRAIPKSCFVIAGAAAAGSPLTGMPPSVGASINTPTSVQVGVSATVPVNLAIICPR
jgi:hypothetical protein